MNLEKLATETRNQKTLDLDMLSAFEIVQKMNEADKEVPKAIEVVLPTIARVVEVIAKSMQKGGRLFYVGAGTSGRLGILDAAECVPTFGTDPELVQGVIAGGEQALVQAVEGAEDSQELAVANLKEYGVTAKDVVVGIAASGRTPYVIGALAYARELGCQTASLACNQGAAISELADYPIEVAVGPEILTGSTRLKSGTAQKLVLNMLSTATMVLRGKVYQNLMVDVQATNQKLVERSKRIIMQATDCDEKAADQALALSGNQVKVAIVMLLTGYGPEQARQVLTEQDGFIRKVTIK